jgi:hypothetical protein
MQKWNLMPYEKKLVRKFTETSRQFWKGIQVIPLLWQ